MPSAAQAASSQSGPGSGSEAHAENPFGFRALCASSWFEARGKKFSVELPHVAVDDARIQLEHFFAHG